GLQILHQIYGSAILALNYNIGMSQTTVTISEVQTAIATAIQELVIPRFDELDADMTEVKQDVRVLKDDVRVLKDDVRVLKDDVRVLKDDVRVLKDDVRVLKEDVGVL